MRLKLCWLLFAVLVALFFVAAPLNSLLRIGGDFRSFLLPIGILGALLVFVVALAKTGRWLKFFFILTGASALGWPISLWLHNILINAFPTEPVTYVLVFYILPVTFVTGVVGTIITGIVRGFSRSGQR